MFDNVRKLMLHAMELLQNHYAWHLSEESVTKSICKVNCWRRKKTTLRDVNILLWIPIPNLYSKYKYKNWKPIPRYIEVWNHEKARGIQKLSRPNKTINVWHLWLWQKVSFVWYNDSCPNSIRMTTQLLNSMCNLNQFHRTVAETMC